MKKYEQALADGICAEQARLFLPSYGMYVRWYWTASVQSVAHFLIQRLEHDAQKEIQDYAKAVLELTKSIYPTSLGFKRDSGALRDGYDSSINNINKAANKLEELETKLDELLGQIPYFALRIAMSYLSYSST
ncbi:FAD-dependent thymidylate synthase [Paenibacillus piri]|uniref:FAD-dependent thymidylate synthase n=1 Tax=Paenibacillus piri TaxID=2547395 RepID=UPI00319EA414